MLIYVDDIIITRSNAQLITSLITKLSSDFAVKDLGLLHFILWIEVHDIKEGLHITREKYVQDILDKADLLNASHISTTMATSSNPSPTNENLVDATTYRSLVRSLQYLSLTRPDIIPAVIKVCQSM